MSEYTGKDVSYYLVEIAAPKRLDPYTAECEDIIEALNMTFAEGCAFKAIWRKCAARTLGLAKAGYKGGLYDAEKTQYYGARMVAVEHREAKQLSMPRQEGENITVHTPEQLEAIYAALGAATDPEGGKISFHLGAQPKYPECEYPVDTAGTHYATCSRLTAPEEYKAEAQVAFEEAARGVGADMAEAMAPGHTIRPAREMLAEVSEAWRRTAEPAAAMDDDSARMQAIGQNGEMAEEVYAAVDAADPFAGAPDWAQYKAQDADGEWCRYACRPVARVKYGHWVVSKGRIDTAGHGEPNPNWRDTLIQRKQP